MGGAALEHVTRLLGFVLGLVILTRHPNAIFAAIVPLYGVTSWRTLRANISQIVGPARRG